MSELCSVDFDTDAKSSTFIHLSFLSAVNRCIMVEELHYRSYVKESKLLSDSR